MPLMLDVPNAIFQSFEEKTDPANVAPRIAALRDGLNGLGVDGVLVPRADAHQGEYVPASDARLAWLTGFTGSAGLAVVAQDKAALFVDSRYTLQAPAQTDISIFTVVDTTTTHPGAWIAANLPSGTKLGFDPWLHTPGQIADFKSHLDKAGIALVAIANPVDSIWDGRPGAPEGPIEILGDNRTGKSSAAKLEDLRATMSAEGADAVVFTLPESLCWLFNIRGRDVPHNPFVLGFGIVTRESEPVLYLAASKLTEDNRRALAGVARLADRASFEGDLVALAESGKTVWFDPASAPQRVKAILSEGSAKLIEKRDPILLPKAIKNEVELAGMREAQKFDGLAMVRFLAWYDTYAPQGRLSEIDIVKQLEAFRRDEPTLVDVSFETISGAGPNGAIVHYRVSNKTNRHLEPGELMLIDSGGQYLSGTTDVTRTLASGSVTPKQKEHFTRVLKGMIALSRARFPRGTTGVQLDILARQFLWDAGLTYNHGTGHGIGAFLSVHEGPAGISPRSTVPLEPGMVLSNEPGYYLEGAYGIRIENLVAVRESAIGDGYLEFETLTLIPIDARLIDTSLLTPAERDWIDDYHIRIREELGPRLAGDNRAWLQKATAPL